MAKLFETPISTSNLYAPDFDRLWGTFSESFSESGELALGKLPAQLEKQLCHYHDAQYCVTFSTGFWALVAAARIKAIHGRSEIIIPSMTYRRLADVVFWTGHVPVMVDIEPKNLAVCARAVEAMISPQTALIMGVHPIVNCCDVKGLLDISQRHQVPIIFDAVESVHETFDSQRIGSFGVGEVFSLHASKLINGLEGGYVCTDDESFRDSLMMFRNGDLPNADAASELISDSPESNQSLGINGVLNDVHAAFAIAGLAEINRNVDHNQRIYRTYVECLNSIDGIDLIRFDESEQTSFKNVVAKIGSPFPFSRDQLVQRLNEEGILARSHYSPALHCKKYQYPVRVGQMTITEPAMFRHFNLPCGSRVTPSDVRIVCQFLAELASN